ncbi:MAG: phenylacetate--CoA ligase family protein [Deltaproteobacteria bacterium]|nr:phenylacetate--CoA ligase family protein [Deltaproteobacteria bacterium]
MPQRDDCPYDDLETRDPEQRERESLAALREQVARAKAQAPGWARILEAVEPDAIRSRADLAQLPVTRKGALIGLQRESPPFGGLLAVAPGALARLYASPGPIFDPEPRGADVWRMARALHAAGFRAGDIVHNSFSYHLTPGGMMMDSGARALGCAVLPAGTGNTAQQLEAARAAGAQGYTGTPSFLKTLLERGREDAAGGPGFERALVSGEALPPSLRAALAEFGVSVLQCYGTADLGLVAYESPAAEGLICDEGLLLEIVRPGSDAPAPEGEVGEVVATLLAGDYPLIRFGTGDLSAVLPGASPCGRSNMRLRGWLGRADQATKVRGMFVRPEQIAELLRRHPEVARARLVVSQSGGRDAMTLACESATRPAGLEAALAQSLQAVTKLRGEVVLHDPGALPNDGKVIEDARSYD